MEEDSDIEILKAKKMQEMMKRMIKQKKENMEKVIRKHEPSEKEILLSYLYDRGDEVLNLAESQFPTETKAITNKIVELINIGEINRKISGGELLSLFRSLGLNVKINTTIKIEEHGKYVSFAEKLKQNKENDDK
ncbi:MAG TPA: DNA-binding protein [Nitrososphaeraceae archaeon]|jgi:DNA-binding TFAR19-related protein (PDSD5 family)|nr:DNA-binding protein [Nitrososphaeraceae archaeon]HEU5172333.1 DNA-binding protein [Nitrososphaeraceae archaeon]